MKKLLFAIPLALLVAAGCNNRQAEVDQLNKTADSLRSTTEMRDSVLGDFLATFNEIEANLDSIAAKQNKIENTMGNEGGTTLSKKEKINRDIAVINQLVEENRAKISTLNKKLKSSNSKNSQLQKTITALNDQLTQKEAELADLNTKLEGLNIQVTQLQTSVDTLTTLSTTQAGTIQDQTTKLHTAYYVVGSSKDLENKNILKRTGGVLGIGKTDRVEPKFNNQDFTMIDYTQTMTIPVDSKDAKIITSHPGTSFKVEKDADGKVTGIKILDAEQFWSISKYLVVIKG